jgi:adenine-specific DNA-methyltransferase
MSLKRKALSVLSKGELLELGYELGLDAKQSMRIDELVDTLAGSKRATIEKVLPLFSREKLRDVCEVLGLPVTAANKSELVDRILGREDEDDDEQLSLLAPKKTASPERAAAAPPAVAAPAVMAAPAARPVPISAAVVAPATEPAPTEPEVDLLAGAPTLSRPVPPRQPRLVWHGWDRHELTSAVPTQVVEIVRPMRVQERAGELGALDVRGRRPSVAPEGLPPNRLIWTNDNIVALKTLLDEKDPAGGYRYRGKVDLVYIDPPFMVQSDFLAQNSIDIDLDDEAGVQVKKEPSLVEILAYKDTWRQGLDSFLSMLRARLELLKELLAPTGSIYVHLDWHAVHYVKVVMDEIFGYECFSNEIVWKRTFARSDAQGFNKVHDTLLSYGASPDAYWSPVLGPHSLEYIRSHYSNIDPGSGRRYQLTSLDSPNPRPNMMYEWKGHAPPAMGWRFSRDSMAALDAQGLINYPPNGRPRFKRFLDDDGMPLQSIWTDVSPVNSQSRDRLGYPTQKPVDLLERVIVGACPEDGLVLDCFSGSGTTLEAAERLGRRWVGIDNGKYAVHLARKRLIQLHGTKRLPEKPQYDYVECDHCNNIERKERAQRSPGAFDVRPFTIENMGVYQRAETWQSFQTEKNVYRDEMIKVFGGSPVDGFRLLHGKKGDSWIHVGPLDGPVSRTQIWDIAREARRTELRHVTVLSADFDTIESGDHDDLAKKLDGMRLTVRVIPAAALDEIRRRIEHQQTRPDVAYSSTAIPAFYAPLAIVLRPEPSGKLLRLHLERCEVDSESFLESQRPILQPITDGMPESKRKKAESERKRWNDRRTELDAWLRKATSWRSFVDFWAIDWQYGDKTGPDGKPIFETDWQSFRQKKGKNAKDELTFVAERLYGEPGHYRVAARVTDVFGNDGIATVEVDVG